MASTAGFFATRARGITIVFIAMVALLTSAAFAQSPVSDDTYVSSATPTTNNGNSPSLVVQKSSNGTTLIKLDLTQLQAAGVQNTAVSKAYLKLYTSAVTGQGTFDLYQVTSSWAEGTVTYNTMPAMTLITAGTSCPVGIQCVNTTSKYVQVDITSLVQGWLSAGTNYGLALKPNATTISVTFEGKESTTTSHAPELDVVLNTSLAQLQGQIGPTQVAPGLYTINISGNASTASSAAFATSAGNTALFGSQPPSAFVQWGVANTSSGSITTNGNIAAGSFTGSGAGLTNLSLPNTLVYNNQPNTFMAGFKQTFTANANYAGLNVAGLGSNPNTSNLAAGDLWFRSDLHHLQAFDGTLVRQLMYSTDTISGSQVTGNISGNAASITGNIPESQVTNLTADLATQTTNLTNEIGARQAADSTLQSNINAEGVARMTADATLQGNIGAETTRAMGAEGTLTTNLNTEVTRAQAAEATKADLVKPVQVNNSALMGGSCTTATADAIVLNRTAPVGQQLLICQMVNTQLQWVLVNDEQALTQQLTQADTTLQNNINTEAAARQAADTTLQNNINTEAASRSAADMTEATNRAAADAVVANAAAAGDVATLASANTYTDNTKTNILTQPQTFSGNDTFSGNNSFGGVNTFTHTVDMTAAKTSPVQTTIMTPPAMGSPNACVAGQMLLQLNGTPGQQLFICNSNLNGWVMVNDDTATTGAANAYTDAQVTIEKNRAMGAEGTLTTNLNNEISRATGAETTLQTNINNEAAARAAADMMVANAAAAGDAATLASANTYTDNTKANILTQPQTFSGNEIFTGDNSFGGIDIFTNKVDLSAATTLPVQTTTTTPPASNNPNACVTGQMLLQTNGTPGKQLFICNAANDGWIMVNDDTATSGAANAYTDQQVAAEAVARTAADNTEAAARAQGDVDTLASANTFTTNAVAGEATARQQGDAATLASANLVAATAVANEASARQQGDAATLAASNTYTDNGLALKANLAGGNNFTGNQAVAGNATVNGTLSLPAKGAGPSPSQALELAGADAGNQPTLFQWFVNNGGFLDLFTGTAGNSPTASGLKIGPDGKITFASGQTFPGTQSLTAGTGIAINGSAIDNTGVLSFNGRNGAVSPASGDYGFAQISGTINSGQVSSGLYGIDISGNANTATSAGTATLAANATNAANSALLGGAAPATAATAGTIAARDGSGDLFASVFHGSGASLTNIPSSALPGNVAYKDAANVFSQTQALAPTGATSQSSNPMRFNATDGSSVSQTAQLLARTDGALSFQFGPTAGSITEKLSIAPNGQIAFAPGQTFPGAQTLTAGTGISIVSNAINNTGVTSLAGTANITASASSGAVTLSLPSTVGVNISGNAATATTATTAATATTASSSNAVPFSGVSASTNAAALVVGTGGSLTTSGTGTINATSLGGVTSANYARTDQANTFTGMNILGNTGNGTGGILIPVSANGSQKASFPFDMEATNTGSTLHLFRIIAQDGTTPNWSFLFCNSAPCTPVANGLSIAGSTGVITFAAGQTFPGAGSGTVTQVNTGTGLTGGPVTTTGTIALANTAVTPGTYTAANITVDAQGRLTNASSNTIPSGTVTSVATGTGLTGGPVTTSGTIAMTTAQQTRTICYVAGADNNTTALDPTFSQKSYFANMVGPMTTVAAGLRCQTDAGTATIQINKNGGAAGTLSNTLLCTTAWGANAGSFNATAIALNEVLDFSITATSGAKRVTACLSATVN